MATVTGYTAERMKAIEDKTVVDGEIQGGNLILLTRDGTPIDAGSVAGPPGPVGPAGPGPIVGEIRMTILTALPTGWLLLNGQTIIDAATLYPELYTAAPASWKNGANLVLPDTTRRHIIGSNNAPGDVGGDDFIRLATGHLPAHSHAKGTLANAAAGAHTHEPSNGAYDFAIHRAGHADIPSGLAATSTTYGLTFTGTTTSTGNHTHGITGNTANTGSGTPYEHRPKYMTVNMMIYAGP